jgi:hypothetical protein
VVALRAVGVEWVPELVSVGDAASVRVGMVSLSREGAGCHRTWAGLSRLVWGVGDCGGLGEPSTMPSSPGREGRDPADRFLVRVGTGGGFLIGLYALHSLVWR